MKVLQINSVCGKGSTGVITTEIADFLKSKGEECYIAFGQGNSDYSTSLKFDTDIENKVHALLYTRILGLQGYGSTHGTYKLINWIKEYKPDIIHLHNLHGNFLNFKMFFDFLSKTNIPIVWSLYDCWSITGKCTHFTNNGCRKWTKECGNCPQLHTSGAKTFLFDRTRKMLADKKDVISKLPNLHMVVCSQWLQSEVQQSHLKNRPIHMIYNWIDQSKFQPIFDHSIYSHYGIDSNKKMVISVSAGWSNNSRFQDAINLSKILPDDFQLVLVGRNEGVTFPQNIIHIPYVNGTKELSKLYSAALVFAGFSVEDTFGKVFAEAMLCGTPCVVFNSTACPEVVGDTGYAVQPHNVNEFVEAIKKIASDGKEVYSQRCIDRVKQCFNYQANVQSIYNLYKEILSNKE